jgi:hypothetical protein
MDFSLDGFDRTFLLSPAGQYAILQALAQLVHRLVDGEDDTLTERVSLLVPPVLGLGLGLVCDLVTGGTDIGFGVFRGFALGLAVVGVYLGRTTLAKK